jgi:hypothetical protein
MHIQYRRIDGARDSGSLWVIHETLLITDWCCISDVEWGKGEYVLTEYYKSMAAAEESVFNK